MDNEIRLIKDTSLFNSLSCEEIQARLTDRAFATASYKKNSVIHFDGERCDKLEIILKGKIVVERIDESGNLMTISDFFSDDILGGNLLFSQNPYYPMTVSTQTPALILEIQKEPLFELFLQNATVLRTYLTLISDHAFILGDKIKHYARRTIRDSLMSYFEYERKKQNSNHIKLDITKKALAERIGVQRTSLSREFAKMQKDGLITFDTTSVTLLDRPSIKR